MHGLIFETSICYWKDQPDRPHVVPVRRPVPCLALPRRECGSLARRPSRRGAPPPSPGRRRRRRPVGDRSSRAPPSYAYRGAERSRGSCQVLHCARTCSVRRRGDARYYLSLTVRDSRRPPRGGRAVRAFVREANRANAAVRECADRRLLDGGRSSGPVRPSDARGALLTRGRLRSSGQPNRLDCV